MVRAALALPTTVVATQPLLLLSPPVRLAEVTPTVALPISHKVVVEAVEVSVALQALTSLPLAKVEVTLVPHSTPKTKTLLSTTTNNKVA